MDSQTGSKVGYLSMWLKQLYDPYAVKWFTDIAKTLDTKVSTYLKHNNPPNDWNTFNIRKTGKLGLTVGVHSTLKDNRILCRFNIRIDSHTCYLWAKQHSYLMDSLLTFRIGPVIFAHPGKKPTFNPKYPTPLQINEMICGFQNREGILTRIDMDSSITVEVQKELAIGALEAVWGVELIK